MKKPIFALLLLAAILCCAPSSFAQTPPDNLNGSGLRTWLKQNYYDGKHSSLGYSTARMRMYNFIDNKNNQIVGVYSGYVKSWTFGGSGTNPMPINAEHTVPQSFFGKSEPMRSDIHHLFPTYNNWNSERSNHPFGEITDSSTDKWMYLSNSQSSIPSSNINSYSESISSRFEPREDQKGNTARAIFYFYTMYPTQAGALSKVGDINVFYQWHLQDPVDANEIARNNGIKQYQGNENPYVSHPEWIGRAWDLGDVVNPPTAYCTSKGNSIADEWINKVTFGSINNTSGANAGYKDYTNLSTDVNKGSAYTITINPSWSGTVYNEAYAVWIDWNQDGDFNDSGESVFTKGASSSTSASGSITVPATATLGETTMRVTMKYNALPSACETFDYGEVEDYKIVVKSGGGSTVPNPAPTNYCSTKGNSISDEWIGKVTIGTINNTTGANGGYGNFTSQKTDVTKGSSYSITINPTWSGTIYSEGYAVWVDWNRDGDFSDSNERVYSKSASKATSATGSFTVPSGASIGYTRMRVSMKYDAIPTACETFTYGEVEDYELNVKSATASNLKIANNQIAASSLMIYPNPSHGNAKMSINLPTTTNVTISVYDINGYMIFSQEKRQVKGIENFEIKDLIKGVYIIRLTGNNINVTKQLMVE